MIFLSINSLNSSRKKMSKTKCMQLYYPTFSCIQETYPNKKNRHQFRVMVWGKIFQKNRPNLYADITILITTKTDIKSKLIKTKSEGQCNPSMEKFTKMTFQFVTCMPQAQSHPPWQVKYYYSLNYILVLTH